MAESASFLEPLKTLHETRSDEQFGMHSYSYFSGTRLTHAIQLVRAFVIEIPAKLTSKALGYVSCRDGSMEA